MTDKFREFSSLLAKGMNFEENSLIFVSGIQNEDGENLDLTLTFNGSGMNVLKLLKFTISEFLKAIPDGEQIRYIRDSLLEELKKDEERRMNEE